MMVKREFEVRQLQATDKSLHVVWEETNLFSVSGTAALAQEQSYFGALWGSSGNHTAWRGLGMVVHGSSTSWVPLGEKLEDHLTWAGVWLQYYPVPLATAPAVDQKLSSDWPWVGDDSWGRPVHQDLEKIIQWYKRKTSLSNVIIMSSNCAWNLWHLVTDLLSCCGGPLGGTVGSGASLSAIRYIWVDETGD